MHNFGFDPFPLDVLANNIDKKHCTSCQFEYFDPPIFGDADFYAKLSRYPWYYEVNKWEYDTAAEIISRFQPNNLLEIGCGNGYFLEKIAQLGINIEGVDINSDAVEVCNVKGLRVNARNVFDISDSFDIVVLFEVLEHMENVRQLFDFFATKLIRPGGYLIIGVPNPDGYLKELDRNLLDMPPHHNSSWSLRCFEQLQARHGFSLVEHKKEPLRYVHYLGFLRSLIESDAGMKAPSIKKKLFYMLQLLSTNLLAPLTYLSDRERIDGQTHLVVLRNERHVA